MLDFISTDSEEECWSRHSAANVSWNKTRDFWTVFNPGTDVEG